MLRTMIKAYAERSTEAGVEGFDSIPLFVDLLKEKGIYPEFLTITEGVNEPECVING